MSGRGSEEQPLLLRDLGLLDGDDWHGPFVPIEPGETYHAADTSSDQTLVLQRVVRVSKARLEGSGTPAQATEPTPPAPAPGKPSRSA